MRMAHAGRLPKVPAPPVPGSPILAPVLPTAQCPSAVTLISTLSEADPLRACTAGKVPFSSRVSTSGPDVIPGAELK